MPLVSLVQQNLQVFGGASAYRNTRFQNAFNNLGTIITAAAGAFPQVPVPAVAVGFTEVMNANAAVSAQMRNFAAPLLANGMANACVNIAIGNTSVGVATDYVGIVYDNAVFQILGSGRVLRVGTNWNCYYAQGVINGNLNYPPAINPTSDYRGVGFIYGTLGAQTYVFGFVHNMLNVGERALLPGALPAIAQTILNAIPDANANIIIGGDFNVDPQNRNGAVNLQYFAATVQGQLQPTTAVNCYDYWFCAPHIWEPVAFIYTATRRTTVTGESDHAAVALQFFAP